MKAARWFLLVTFVAVAMFPQVIFGADKFENVSRDGLKDVSPEGRYVWNKSVSDKFGDYAYEAFKAFPEIIEITKKAKSNFKTKNVGVSFPSKAFELRDGRTLILLRGCTPHNCAGTENIIAYDYVNRKAYVLAEGLKSDFLEIYGNPDQEIKKVLLNCYLNHK